VRYNRLSRLSTKLDWHQGQYDTLDALVEPLRTDNRWLEYRLRAVQDALLDQGARTTEGGSVVDMVKAALLEPDEALHKARMTLAEMQTAAAEKETALAAAQAQLQQDHATLEGARSWQTQAMEKAKEVERLGADLADKVASLAAVGEQLLQEQSTRQQAGTRLQQEQSALKETWATLERECLAREEAQGQLHREHTALKARATLKLRDAEITRLTWEMIQEGVSYEDLRQASEEKDAIILELQQAAATTCTTLESEKKQVEGELLFLLFTCWLSSLGSAPDLVHIFAFRPADDSWDVGDPSAGDLDSLQLLPAGAGGAASRGPRGVPGHQGRRRAGRELHDESPPCLARACYPAYAPCTPPRGLESPWRGGVALPGQLRAISTGYVKDRYGEPERGGGGVNGSR
jgi:hypothetical protein